MTNQAVYEVIGAIGGVAIALSLVPQVIHTYRIKKAGDISYTYQCIYIVGCTFTNIYAIPLGLWPLYVPCLIEQGLIMLLTAMKYVYDKEEARKSLILKEGGPTQHSILSKTIKASEEDVADVEAATVTMNKS